MTTRNMSAKGFLHKTTSKAAIAVTAFVAAHREYLTTGEVSSKTASIVARLDAREILPSEALPMIQQAVMAHIAITAERDAQHSAEQSTESRSSKPFCASIIDSYGSVVFDAKGEPMQANFDLPQRASEWCDRRLFEGSSEWHGEIVGYGKECDIIERDDSIARILKRPLSAVTKRMGSSGSLGFGTKVKPSVVKFSRG